MTDSPHSPIVDQIRGAGSKAEIAEKLLKLSDAVLLAHHVDIELVLAQVGFGAGSTFIVYRVTALCRNRDAHGMLPHSIAHELEGWRGIMSRIAAGEGGAL